MSITGIFLATVIVGGTGLLLGLFLGFFGKKFYVEVDERVEQIQEALPGNNCGGCGYAGCSALAEAIGKGEAPIDACPVGGAATAAIVGKIMGKEAGVSKRMTAFVKCAGSCEKTSVEYEYYGIQDCAMMNFVPGQSSKKCKDGCLGYGSCVQACLFDAIHIQNGIAVVDREKCKACGKCIAACPKHLIEMIPYDAKHMVACSSKAKGKQVMASCETGCIGCKKCEKVCEKGAVTVKDNLAWIDQEKCVNCGACKEACPRKVIL